MSEDFLQFIWRYGLFHRYNLRTGNNEKVEVIKLGDLNSDSGPDFLNARVRIGRTLWAGNIEIHVKSSDWYKHGHHTDNAFRNVILQAVWEHDREAIAAGGQSVPTVQITFDERYYSTYTGLMGNPGWIPCFTRITSLKPLLFESWVSSLTVERLQQRREAVVSLLKQNCNNWDEAFYVFLGRSFGSGVNSIPFEMLARSLPLTILDRHKGNLFQVKALLYGQAGFPGMGNDIPEINDLVDEYKFLQVKYNLKPLEKHLWKFMRTRPANFPDVRIGQLALLLTKRPRLLSAVVECKTREDIVSLFRIEGINLPDDARQISNIPGKGKPPLKSTTSPGKSFTDNLIINCAVPFIYIYGQENGVRNLCRTAVDILESMPAEKNRITRNWEKLGIVAENAFHSQGLIQITMNYCMKKRCLSCAVGNRIITM